MAGNKQNTGSKDKEKSQRRTRQSRVPKIIISDKATENQIISKRPEPEYKDKIGILDDGKVVLASENLFLCLEPECSALFTQKRTFSLHQNKHRNRQIRCEFCDTTFKTVEEKANHLNNFHPNLEENPAANPLECIKCKKITSSRFALRRHLGRSHPTQKIKCQHCDYEFTRRDALVQHLKHKHPPKGKEAPKYPCEICDKVYLYSPDLRKHIRTVHRPKNEGEEYNCVICKTIFDSKDSYKRHMFYHIKPIAFSCKYCNCGFRSAFKLKEHTATAKHKRIVRQHKKASNLQQTKARQVKVKMEEGGLESFSFTKDSKDMVDCPNTIELAPMNKSLEELLKMGKDELFEFCWRRVPKIILPKITFLRTSKVKMPDGRTRMKRHIRNPSNQDVVSYLKCVYCHEPYSNLQKLELHETNCFRKLRTGSDKKFKCNICQKEFDRRHKYQSHIIIHSTERLLKCNYCDKTFKRRESRLSHEKHIHFGFERKKEERKYKCNYSGCDKQFVQRRSLQRHIRSAHLEIRVRCDKCDQTFSREEYLKDHKRIQHGDQLVLFECRPCNRKFRLRRYYINHSKKPRHIRKMQQFAQNKDKKKLMRKIRGKSSGIAEARAENFDESEGEA